MKKRNKLIALSLVAAMLTGSVLIGCGDQAEEQKTSTQESKEKVEATVSASKEEAKEQKTGIDLSEHVDLVFYLAGDSPEDMGKVQDKINEILEEKINASITFQFLTWTDHVAKNEMILSGGEDVDMIFTAPWLSYYKLLEKDAFLDLNVLIDQYAPELREAIAPVYFEQTYVDGALYTLPNNYEEYNTNSILYREDLRKKYDLPIPNTPENFMAYLAGIKENEPDMLTITPVEFGKMYGNLEDESTWGKAGLQVYYNNVNEIVEYWGSDEHVEYLKACKESADAGYWPVDAISRHNEDPQAGFQAGKSAIYCSGANIGKYLTLKDGGMADPSWEVGYVSYAEINGVAYPALPLQNGTAIPVTSKNPERAIMAISLLYTDEELNHLLMYGIEGEHYTVDDNGYYVGVEGSKFPYEGSNAWNFRNSALLLKKESDVEKYELFDELSAIASKTVTPYVNHYAMFSGVITENVSQEAAINALYNEYILPLEYGMVDDIEGTVAEFMEKAKEAGLEKLQAEYKALWNEYLESKGY